MWFNKWYAGWPVCRVARTSGASNGPRVTGALTYPAHRSGGRAGVRLHLEQLEDRTLMSNFFAATASDLIADINAANAAGGTNTITLTARSTSPYILSKVDNTTDGPTGLPVIVAGDTLVIVGNADTIERSTKSAMTAFRLFDVASSASLTLENLTLQNGLAFGSGSAAEGGAIFNHGSLTLSGVMVQNNVAAGSLGANAATAMSRGSNGQDAAGGGIWSNGVLILENSTAIQNNNAEGGNGGSAFNTNYGSGPITSYGGTSGNGWGAGLDIAGGTGNLSGGTLYGNNAMGGQGGSSAGTYNGRPAPNGGQAGAAYGGGLNAVGATVSLAGVTVQANTVANSGAGLYISNSTANLSGNSVVSNNGRGIVYVVSGTTASLSFSSTNDAVESNIGGGIFIDGSSAATVSYDTVENNNASSSDGGGIALSQSTATVSYDTVAFNASGEYGGGISIFQGTTTVSNDGVESNTAGNSLYGFGGGISVNGPATGTFTNEHIESNTVGGTSKPAYRYPQIYGGGIYLSCNVTATFDSDTVVNNSALGSKSEGGAYGGGIYIGCSSTVTFCSTTVQGNTAMDYGGGIYFEAGVGGATVYIDAFTVAHTINNTDSSGLNGPTANIDGTYILRNC